MTKPAPEVELPLDVREIKYHRNGIIGEGFHVVRFAEPERKELLTAVVFPARGYIAVIHPTESAQMFRGVVYEERLRTAVEKTKGETPR